MSIAQESSVVETLKATRAKVLAAFLCAVVSATAVNFLGAVRVPSVPPLAADGSEVFVSPFAINGTRTLVAAILLFLPTLFLGIRLKLSFSDFWRYAVIATLTMAIPQSLIFLGLQVLKVTPTTVAFVECALIGIVFVSLLSGPESIPKLSFVCAALCIGGLAIFLGITPQSLPLSKGDLAILGATVATGFGYILADRIAPQVHKEFPFQKSLRKTFFTCLIAGVEVLVTVGIMNIVFGLLGKPQEPVSFEALRGAWPLLLTLAVVGNIMTWYPIFLLIDLKQSALAAAVVAGIPILTEVANYIWFKPTITTFEQWAGGLLVVIALAVLIRVQLLPRKRNS